MQLENVVKENLVILDDQKTLSTFYSPIIDTHTHILPQNIPDMYTKYGYGEWITLDHHKPHKAKMIQGGKVFREIEDNCWDTKRRLKEMDENGVSVQVLSTVPVMFNYAAKPEHSLEFAQYLNEDISHRCEQHPDRFVGLGSVPLQNTELACKELHRCMEELGLAGVQIGSHVNDLPLGHPSLFKFFAEAADLGACIFVHPWDMIGEQIMKKYWLPWLVGMPFESSFAISSLIFSGVFEKLPNLRMCFAHGGGSFPYLCGRISHGFKMRPDLCAVDNNVDPKQYLGRFWVDSHVNEQENLDYLMKSVGADHICCGTDYPFPLGELIPGELIKGSKCPIDVKNKMLHDNAVAWLGKPLKSSITK